MFITSSRNSGTQLQKQIQGYRKYNESSYSNITVLGRITLIKSLFTQIKQFICSFAKLIEKPHLKSVSASLSVCQRSYVVWLSSVVCRMSYGCMSIFKAKWKIPYGDIMCPLMSRYVILIYPKWYTHMILVCISYPGSPAFAQRYTLWVKEDTVIKHYRL